MQEESNSKNVELLAEKNNMKPNHVIKTTSHTKPKVNADMEKIASVIGIKNIIWSETRNHVSGHDKIKGDVRREILAKSPAYANAELYMQSFTCSAGWV